MPDICSASAIILALSDADVLNLGPKSQRRGKRLLERTIDVRLDCDFNFTAQDGTRGNLVVKSWGGTTGLCGACSFCGMLADGLERVSRSELPIQDKALEVDSTGSVDVEIVIRKLEYHKDASTWAVGEGNSRTWDIHLLLFRATAALSSEMESPGRIGSIPVDVAFELFGTEKDPISTALRILRRPLQTSPLSDCNIEQIQKWIRDCDGNHEKCLKDVKLDYLPTRLLDVGALDCGKGLRLILSNETFSNTGNKPKYMALSYCWGAPEDSRDLLTTTKETLSSRLSGIKIDSMPQTFKDAVQTARALGIRYIWIDSLCIIQDNAEDWKFESSRMAEIFSTAYFTVIAASSDSCHDGFLQRKTRPHCSVPLKLNDLSSGPIEGAFSLRYRQHWGTDKMAEIRQGRWISRGWTFQEERLARRALIFGEGKMFLDCRTLERLEDTSMYKHRPDWVASIRDTHDNNEDIDPVSRTSTGSFYHRRTPFDHWHTICSHYSRRSLTYEKDKLPAISGMARQIPKKLGVETRYLAGLWRENLLHDLFWQPVNIGLKPRDYRAPSWSWASLDGHVSWPTWRFCVDDRCEIYCEIVDAQTSVDLLDPFGAVTGGSLKVNGKVIGVETAYIGSKLVSTQRPWGLNYRGKMVATGRIDVAISEDLHEMKGKFWALLAAKCKVKEGRLPVPRGLLLKKTGRVCEDGSEEFERVGIFRATAEDREGSSLAAWEEEGKKIVTII